MSANSQADVPVVDAEIVTEPPVSLELARRERRSEVIRPLDAAELVESFAAYQALLPQLLEDSDYQGTGTERFVKKSGWRKIATAFDLDIIGGLEAVQIDRDETGSPIRAAVCVTAVTAAGRRMVGDGYCSIDEPRFARAGGRQKLEHDLASTAFTRAKNRAIADLVGMGAVSAEEVDTGASSSNVLPWGPKLAGKEHTGLASRALQRLAGPNAAGIWRGVQERHGYMPLAVADSFIHLARALDFEEAQAV